MKKPTRTWSDVSAVLLLLAAGCSSSGSAPVVPVQPVAPPDTTFVLPGPRILTAEETTALAALLKLEDRRSADLGLLETYANDASDEVRRRAVLAAGRIGNRLAAPMLRAALEDTMALVAASAAFALGELGDTTTATIEALENLLARTWNERDPRGIEAAGALGKLTCAASFMVMQRILERYVSTDSVPAARSGGQTLQEALLAVWHFPDARALSHLVSPHLKAADTDIRWRATYALMRMAAPAAVPLLIEQLEDDDASIRSLAARGLRAPTADSAGERENAHDALVRALGDRHPHVRINALGALATFGADASSAILPILDDRDANVRLAAAQALASTPGPGVTLRVRALAEDASVPIGVRAVALTTLARLDIEQAVQEAARWADAATWLERLLAVRALGNGEWPATRPVLRDLAADPDARVARAALGAVRRVADTTSVAYALYVQSLKAADPDVRATAIAAIGRRGNPADLATLMDAYDSAQRDSVADAAIAAVDALSSLARDGLPVESAFFLRFDPHPDAAVRRRVLERFTTGDRTAWAIDTASVSRTVPDSSYVHAVRTWIAPALAGESRPHLEIDTPRGTIVIELASDEAPLTVANMAFLVESRFFDARGDEFAHRWHRVVPNFVLQDGDPRGDGSGGPEHRIRDEINTLRYLRGTLGMALSGPDTGGSQFFITHSPQPHLDGGYTVFGRVVSGMDAADLVVQDEPILAMRIVRP
ncbi:MAG: HEAT repeat domain-containing protein [Longimicrobiales bacterium]